MSKMLSKGDFESYQTMFLPQNLSANIIYRVLFDLVDENKAFDLMQIKDFIVRQQIYQTEDLLVFDEVLLHAVFQSETIICKCFEPSVKRLAKDDGFAAFSMVRWCALFRKAAAQKPVELALRGSEACVPIEPEKS